VFERFTSKARSAVLLARGEARRLGLDAVGTEHLLLGIIEEPTSLGARALFELGIAADDARRNVEGATGQSGQAFAPDEAEALQSLGIDLDEVRRAVEETFGAGALDAVSTAHPKKGSGRIRFTPRLKKAIEVAFREAQDLGHHYIGTEHLVLGLVQDPRSTAARVLQKCGIDIDQVGTSVLREIDAGGNQSGRTA
jgi:ATP-dependent Clp protease ATP-binding subunit ClpA